MEFGKLYTQSIIQNHPNNSGWAAVTKQHDENQRRRNQMPFLLVSLLMIVAVGGQEQKCDLPSKMELYAPSLNAYQIAAIDGEVVFTLINVKREVGHVQGVCLGLY